MERCWPSSLRSGPLNGVFDFIPALREVVLLHQLLGGFERLWQRKREAHSIEQLECEPLGFFGSESPDYVHKIGHVVLVDHHIVDRLELRECLDLFVVPLIDPVW